MIAERVRSTQGERRKTAIARGPPPYSYDYHRDDKGEATRRRPAGEARRKRRSSNGSTRRSSPGSANADRPRPEPRRHPCPTRRRIGPRHDLEDPRQPDLPGRRAVKGDDVPDWPARAIVEPETWRKAEQLARQQRGQTATRTITSGKPRARSGLLRYGQSVRDGCDVEAHRTPGKRYEVYACSGVRTEPPTTAPRDPGQAGRLMGRLSS